MREAQPAQLVWAVGTIVMEVKLESEATVAPFVYLSPPAEASALARFFLLPTLTFLPSTVLAPLQSTLPDSSHPLAMLQLTFPGRGSSDLHAHI